MNREPSHRASDQLSAVTAKVQSELVGGSSGTETIASYREFRLRPSAADDAKTVSRQLRPSDLLDIAATSPLPPHAALLASLRLSNKTFAIDFNRQCIALAGVQHHAQLGQTAIWLLGSPGFDAALAAGGWRVCKPWLELIAG